MIAPASTASVADQKIKRELKVLKSRANALLLINGISVHKYLPLATSWTADAFSGSKWTARTR